VARVDRASISQYYNQTLLPQLRQQGAPPPPLSEVSDKIQQVLTEQRINELLNSWLEALRSQAQIEKMPESPADSQVAAGAKQ
jgi:peptidyl-prolyl cis-trans isomerase SurA